jgi:hypothetical protein
MVLMAVIQFLVQLHLLAVEVAPLLFLGPDIQAQVVQVVLEVVALKETLHRVEQPLQLDKVMLEDLVPQMQAAMQEEAVVVQEQLDLMRLLQLPVEMAA